MELNPNMQILGHDLWNLGEIVVIQAQTVRTTSEFHAQHLHGQHRRNQTANVTDFSTDIKQGYRLRSVQCRKHGKSHSPLA